MDHAIETAGLTKHYGRVSALTDVSLHVDTGAVFGVIGPNGAGKTTMMRLLLDIIRPSAGSARVLGLSPREGAQLLRRNIGFVPGDLRLEGRVSGRQLLRHYARISGPVAPRAIDEIAERLGLDLGRQVRTLSRGNKQKLALVQAFMHEPALLVLDEPTSGLDPLVQREFLTMVREAKQNGQTVFLSSHVLSEIQQAADSVAILREGRVVTISDVEALRLTAVRRVRVGITGSSPEAVRRELEAMPHLTELTVGGSGEGVRVTARIEGEIDPFVKTIGAFRVSDLAVEEPDLEESVLRMYGAPGDRPAGDREADNAR